MFRKIIKKIFCFFRIKISVIAQILEISKIPKNVKKYSLLDEENIIAGYLAGMKPKRSCAVDIAAGDGIGMSNTYALYKKGWVGVAIECDPVGFSLLSRNYRDLPDVDLIRIKITPDNVNSILEGCSVPPKFALLNLDIDGYDHYVLDSILSIYRPSLICAEINENIPPPIKFSVSYDPDHFWQGKYFYGQSISQLFILCERYKYDLVKLHYNSAFLVSADGNKHEALTPEQAYNQGYRCKADRKEKFPQNREMEPLLKMRPDEITAFLNEKFKEYKGKYTIGY